MANETKEKSLSKAAKQPSVESFPWERRPDESSQAYARFLAYRTMPPSERGIRKVGVSMQLAARWSRRHGWVKRALAYDDYLAELSDSTAQHAVLCARRSLVRLGLASANKAHASLEKLDETKLDANEIVALGKLSVVTMEQAFGGPTVRQPPSGPSVIVQTQVGYGEARPSWLERSETKASETKPEVVVQVEEKVLERRQTGGPRTVQGKDKPKLPPPRGKLKQLVLSAPVRVEDP